MIINYLVIKKEYNMNIKINREILINNLLIVSKALSTNVIINRNLSGIKMEAKNKTLTLIANSGDIAIKQIVSDPSLIITKEDTILVPGKSIIEMIKKIDEPTVELYMSENQLLIKSNSLEYKLNLFKIEDFPEVEFFDSGNSFTLNSNTIKNISKEVGFSAAVTDKRPHFQGVHFLYDNMKLRTTATDSFRLSTKTLNIDFGSKKMEFIIPSKAIDELSRILDYHSDDVSMVVKTNVVIFKHHNTLFRTRLLEGQFPDILRIIPSAFTLEIPFNKEELIRAIDKVSITSSKDNNSKMNQLQFKLRLDKIVELTAINDTGSSKQEVNPCGEIDSKPFEMLLNLKYLLDAVKSLSGVEIKICIVDTRKPIVIKDITDLQIIHVILPLTI